MIHQRPRPLRRLDGHTASTQGCVLSEAATLPTPGTGTQRVHQMSHQTPCRPQDRPSTGDPDQASNCENNCNRSFMETVLSTAHLSASSEPDSTEAALRLRESWTPDDNAQFLSTAAQIRSCPPPWETAKFCSLFAPLLQNA